MKNLKKLNRTELKTINGNGILDNVIGVVNGVGTVAGNTLTGIGGVVNGVGTGVVTTVGGAVAGLGGVVETTLCQVQCVVNGVVTIKVLACGSTC
ncbi:bacteriocin-like protein [Chryseobacterium wanjuense]